MKNTYSFYTFIAIAIIEISVGVFYYPKWTKANTEATISWDASGYYLYLPAIFIYHDLKQCAFMDDIIKKYQPAPDFQQAFIHPSGNRVMKYAGGQAIILSPTFFVAHLYCKVTKNYPADGFSKPYQFAISIWALCISLIGIFILRKVLLFYFTDSTVALTIFSIALCTNYLDYAAINGAMTHNSLFTLYTFLLLVTIRFYQNPTAMRAILIGGLCGLATLTRPTEVLSLLIPLSFGLYSFASIKGRISFFIREYKMTLLAGFAFLAMIFIQLGYWKYAAGEWLVYSYQDQGFDWFSPHIYKCLFSVKAGWLLYSPIFVFAIVGLYFLFKNFRPLFFSSLVFLIPFTYACFAWHEWWYGWSLGQRAMMQSYPIWAFPLAAFFSFIFTQKKVIRYITFCFVFVCFLYNGWLVHQCHLGGLFKGPEMTRAYYLTILGKLEIDPNLSFLLDNPDNYLADIKDPQLLYQNNFDSDTSSNAILVDSMSGNRMLLLSKEKQTSIDYFFSPSQTPLRYYKLSADFDCGAKEWDTWRMAQFCVRFYRSDSVVKQNFVRVYRLLNENQSKRIHFFAKTPIEKFDKVGVLFYNAESDKQIGIDNLKVEGFND